MMKTDYKTIIDESFEKFALLYAQRENLDAELLKLRQFIYATINMLADEQRQAYNDRFDELTSQTGGLTEAIKDILKVTVLEGKYVTVAQVRDHLKKAGFDFSRYTSNPLASVNSVLKRFKPSEVESTTIDGVAAYRWICRFPRTDAEESKRRAFIGRSPGASRSIKETSDEMLSAQASARKKI
jgi:hypothetical protein